MMRCIAGTYKENRFESYRIDDLDAIRVPLRALYTFILINDLFDR